MIVDRKGNIFQDRRKKENEGIKVKKERRSAPQQEKARTTQKQNKSTKSK